MSNARFGDARNRQSRLQKHRLSLPGSGKRRVDPQIHATSRPWHTSTPGIRMNVSTLGQIAARDKVAARYLNKMNLSEMAQKKRGIAEKEKGRGYDKTGLAMLRGLRHSQGRGKMSAPNQDRIDRYHAELTGRIGAAEARAVGPVTGPAQQNMYERQVTALKGDKKKIPKRKYHAGPSHPSSWGGFQY